MSTTEPNSASSTVAKINLPDVIRDMFIVLNTHEKEVITKRFDLTGEGKRTLEYIGKNLSLTRERIRQIQVAALKKLSRTVKSTILKKVNVLALEIIKDHGGIMREDKVVSEVLNRIENPSAVDGQIIRLLLSIEPEIQKRDRSDKYYEFWHLSSIREKDINQDIDSVIKLMEKKKDILSKKEILDYMLPISTLSKDEKVLEKIIEEILYVDKRFKETEGEKWGLKKWRHINPRSICDKIYIILKKEGKPLHFIDIANRIVEEKFDKKSVTVQAVHNELIRFEPFVLIGRGLYALKEWGYREGTVADIIEDVLKKYKGPIKKQVIVDGVLKQRDVRLSTISLNLQKNPHFVRVGRAVYQLDLSKKPELTSRRGHRNSGKKKKALPK